MISISICSLKCLLFMQNTSAHQGVHREGGNISPQIVADEVESNASMHINDDTNTRRKTANAQNEHQGQQRVHSFATYTQFCYFYLYLASEMVALAVEHKG